MPDEIQHYPDGSIRERRSRVPEIATIGALSILALSVAFHGFASIGGGGGGSIPTLPTIPITYDPPNAPSIIFATPLDTSTVVVAVSSFSGDQNDIYDSLRIMIDSAGGTFTSPFIDVKSGAITIDTITDNVNLTESGVYDVVALQKGALSGQWSVASAVRQYVNGTDPVLITNLSIIASSDTSLTLQWTATPDGIGGVARAAVRVNDTTAVNAVWWVYDVETLDSSAVAVGDTVTWQATGLLSSTLYSVMAKSYRGYPGVNSYYNPGNSNIVEGTTLEGLGGGPIAPSIPTASMSATADTSKMQIFGTAYDGENQTHDSTRFVMDNNNDLSSPFKDTVTIGITSLTVTDNANLTAGNTYYGAMAYYASSTGWTSLSGITSKVNTVPGNHPNLPDTFVYISDTDFCDPVSSTGWSEHDPGNRISFPTPPNPGPISPDCVARWTWPQGVVAGVGNQQISLPVITQTQYSALYVHYWIWIDSNWSGWLNGTNKFVFMTGLQNAGQGTNNFWSMQFSGASNPTVTYHVQPPWAFSHPSGKVVPANGFKYWNRDTWAEIELIVQAESFVGGVSQDDGILRAWVNGQNVYDNEGVDHMLGTEAAECCDPPWLNRFSFYQIWGGGTTIEDHDMWWEMDHAFLYGYPY